MVYLIGWVLMFISACFALRRSGYLFFLIPLIYCAVISVFRGSVGTDTAAYITIFEDLALGEAAPFSEPGFKVLSYVLIAISPDPEIAVKAISVVFLY